MASSEDMAGQKIVIIDDEPEVLSETVKKPWAAE